MKKDVDYNLLVQAERIRFQSDFSSAHWLHQLLSRYENGITNKLRRDAFESVLRAAINHSCTAAIKLANTFPKAAGFPEYINLTSDSNWDKTALQILNNFDKHISNRFRYAHDGD